ncbi:uncharacterized protein BKA55DRAFT_542641 [Fusarium redolens]|uniref:Uncharacterized protein n=1 Tax=Fusarium redolens TaxID=48865 RepID=A0A9P9K4N6_FUSRE|nr:uncharacterized protein BKA55DRAFT_542641 [Fusarium redolens]KAH7240044.1 hypothetical protein BKA55DRAFT_542641 [Fusarium redolens]
MHRNIFLLAVGLIAGSAFASPCKPQGTTSVFTTSDVTSTVDSSVTTILVDTTTAATSDATSEVPTTAEVSSTAELSVTTSLEASTTATIASDTTTLTSDSESSTVTSVVTTSEAETTTAAISTSTAPEAIPTYSLLANGGNLNNQQPQSNIELTSLLVFDPAYLQTGGIRTFTIEPTTGHLQDANGAAYLCAYYEGSRGISSPPPVGYCDPSNTGPNKPFAYLKCQVSSGALSCNAPRTTCEDGDDNMPVCTTPAGNNVYNKFYTDTNGIRPGGKSSYWYIGTDSPDRLTPLSITAAEVQ